MNGAMSDLSDELEAAIEGSMQLGVTLMVLSARKDVPRIHRVQLDTLARSVLGVESGLKRIWEQNRREELRFAEPQGGS